VRAAHADLDRRAVDVTPAAARTTDTYWWRRDEVRTEAPSSPVGIEEEYQIIDPETRELQGGIDKI